ncbi:hypothetical protein, partial [Nocardia cyriacigeorgica]|uniref:hypothetical protein n=1 Tax=Nocardia cyriacigeorgica TaxID=135487 RepID=UPI002453CEA9
FRSRHRPARPRSALRHRREPAAHRARLAAALRRFPGRPRIESFRAELLATAEPQESGGGTTRASIGIDSEERTPQ